METHVLESFETVRGYLNVNYFKSLGCEYVKDSQCLRIKVLTPLR